MAPQTIISGFKATGVFPLNRRAIKVPGNDQALTNTPIAVLARRGGIQYMPFLSQKSVPTSRVMTYVNESHQTAQPSLVRELRYSSSRLDNVNTGLEDSLWSNCGKIA